MLTDTDLARYRRRIDAYRRAREARQRGSNYNPDPGMAEHAARVIPQLLDEIGRLQELLTRGAAEPSASERRALQHLLVRG